MGFTHFECVYSFIEQKNSNWLDFVCFCALPNNFNLHNIFGPIDRKQSALLLYREKVAAIYCIEYYYCVMWFVRIVAKFKPNKPHPIFNFLHTHSRSLNKVIHSKYRTYCASSVIYRNDSIHYHWSDLLPLYRRPFITWNTWPLNWIHRIIWISFNWYNFIIFYR